MLSVYTIIEILVPLGNDCNCGTKKSKKLAKRNEIVNAVYEYRHGRPVDFTKIEGIDHNKLIRLLK